jgi:hypothetical protein
MCHGEPSIATAELPIPQSCRVAMCPPQARTADPSASAVKVSVMLVCVSPFCLVVIV